MKPILYFLFFLNSTLLFAQNNSTKIHGDYNSVINIINQGEFCFIVNYDLPEPFRNIFNSLSNKKIKSKYTYANTIELFNKFYQKKIDEISFLNQLQAIIDDISNKIKISKGHISDDFAMERADKLIRMVELVYKPMTEKEFQLVQERRKQTGDI